MDFSAYRRRVSSYGDTLRDSIINEQKWKIKQQFHNSTQCKQVTIDDVPRELIVTRTAVSDSKTIYSIPDEDFQVGQVVYYSGSHWLITNRDLDDDIWVKGYMELCNREIYWQNPETTKIHSLWATVRKPYYSNLEESQRITVSSREFKIQMPYTEESALINIGKRFMLEIIAGEPKTYMCTSVDSMTKRYDRNGEIVGFIVLNIEQDLYNPLTDNAELMICDYIDPNDKLENDFFSAHISYVGDPVVRAGGSYKKFTGSFDKEDSIGTWEIDYNGIEPDKIHIIEDGDTISISVTDDMYLIGRTFYLTYSSNETNKRATMEIEVT